MAVVVNEDVERFRFEQMFFRLRMESQIFARESVKTEPVTRLDFPGLDFNSAKLGRCDELEIWNGAFRADATRNLELGRF